MGRIPETHIKVAIVTIVTVKVGGETYIPLTWCMDVRKRN